MSGRFAGDALREQHRRLRGNRWRMIARALEMRRARYPLEAIARDLDVNVNTIRTWTDSARLISRKLHGPALRTARRLLLRGTSPEAIAAKIGVGERTIHNAIREGRLPPKSPAVVQCSACGKTITAPSRNPLGVACSDRCRRALANACKTMTRWRARGRALTADARELITAQALLRLEITGGNDGN